MDAYVLDTVRTPRGKAKAGGGLSGLSALDLLVQLCDAIRARGLDPGTVDDVIVGCATQVGEQGGNPARTAAILAGWGEAVPGVTINRFCASGIDAVATAAARVRSGSDEMIVAGGVESVSRVPMFSDEAPLWTNPDVVARVGSVHMGIAGDLVATLEGYDRDELDAYGLSTQARAADAWAAGRFARSLVPVTDATGAVVCDRDEHVRPGLTIQDLHALEPSFAALGADGQDAIALDRYPNLHEIRHLHTRGTSPSLADAAGLVTVGTLAVAERTGQAPRARILSSAVCSVDAVTMLTAGQMAVEKAIGRAGLTPDDVDLFEFAEAFAALCVKFKRDLGVGDDRFNVNGGTIAMGHAFGATGAILVATLLDELERREGRYGVVGVSGAGGLGVAAVFERWREPRSA